uniref:MalT-like TPR region domain-containing protein n=1 Tax=Thermogemmatispora argillosa TaxID=2045280 RepID=A0A455SX31_9CHLR|nr:hypothetical protein KTA_02770 [Thermogemmatispora argillosa]
MGLAELLTEQARQADLLIELAQWLLRQPGRRDEGQQLCRRAEQCIALLADGPDKALLFIWLGEGLGQAELLEEAECCWHWPYVSSPRCQAGSMSSLAVIP